MNRNIFAAIACGLAASCAPLTAAHAADYVIISVTDVAVGFMDMDTVRKVAGDAVIRQYMIPRTPVGTGDHKIAFVEAIVEYRCSTEQKRERAMFYYTTEGLEAARETTATAWDYISSTSYAYDSMKLACAGDLEDASIKSDSDPYTFGATLLRAFKD